MSAPFTREDMVDAIADAISDSMDMDWTSRTGAEAVVRNCGLFEVYETGQWYMDSVKALFKIDPRTKKCFAEGSPTKDDEVFDRFVRFNDAGKAFSAALAKVQS